MKDSLNIIFAGTPDFSVPSLRALIESKHQICAVYTQPDRPAGRGRKLKSSPVKEYAEAHGIPVYQPENLRNKEEIQTLVDLKADVMVVIAYGIILPKSVLDSPNYGCVNVHASLLPRWRGAAPIHRAVLAGDRETGVTIMQMDEGLDTGAMLYKVTCPIDEQTTTGQLHDELALVGASALLATLDELIQGTSQAQAQEDALATYAKKLSKSEAMIQWAQSAKQISQQVRAFNPWPVAQTKFGEQTLRVWMAIAVVESATAYQLSETVPGAVIHADNAGIEVMTGAGILRITQLQMPGKKPISATDFANSYDIQQQVLG